MDEVIFCEQINSKVFYKLILLSMYVARYAESTQSNKFAISLQYLKENINDEVDILPAEKRQRFPQIDTIIFSSCCHACPNYPE